MFIAYLDSSGKHVRTDPENYVLAAIVINERSWHAIESRINDVKKKHFLHPNNTEFHATDMMHRAREYKNLAWDEIYAILNDVFAVIADAKTRMVVIAVLIQKSRLKKDIDIEKWAHRLLFEMINEYLKEQNASRGAAGCPAEYGMVIIDTEGPKKDQKLRSKLYQMLVHGTLYSKLNHLIEDPLFTDSRWRNLSQIADCVAYCIRRRYRENTASTHASNWNRYYDMLEPKFYNVGGTYHGYGLKIFPK